MLTEQTTKLIQDWLQAKSDFELAKNTESVLRIKVLEECFKEPPESGTQHYELNEGYKLTAIFKQNNKIADKEKLEKALTEIEKIGEDGKLIASRIIKWKPELSITEYKLLPSEMLNIINDVVEFSPGSPTLTFVEPKKKR